MGDRTTTFNDCPKCGSKGTFECYEALSSSMKVDECSECGYRVDYDIDDTDDVITVTRTTPELPVPSEVGVILMQYGKWVVEAPAEAPQLTFSEAAARIEALLNQRAIDELTALPVYVYGDRGYGIPSHMVQKRIAELKLKAALKDGGKQ